MTDASDQDDPEPASSQPHRRSQPLSDRRARGPTVGPGVTVTDPRRRPVGFLGACVGAFALATLVPPVGGLAGAAFLAAWFLAPAPPVVGFGTIAFAALSPADPTGAAPTPVVAALAGIGALAVLADALRTGDTAADTRAAAALVLTAVVLLAVVGVATTATDAAWLLAVVLVVAGTTLAYGTHRYERVTMGLVPEDDP